MDTDRFKYVLKELRLEKGVKQKEVAKQCDISPQCVSQLELGTRNPTGTTLLALANYFNCSVDYLLGRSDDYEIQHSAPFVHPTTKQESDLLATYKNLPDDLKRHLSAYAKKLLVLYKEQKNQ